MQINQYETEIPKYHKSTESDISKSNRKSKHKHQYEECLIQYHFAFADKNRLSTCLCDYCTICGKINNEFKETKITIKDRDISASKFHPRITSEELYERYHDKMPVFFIKDIYRQKYVDLE